MLLRGVGGADTQRVCPLYLQVSAGGLVSALMGVHNFRATWIGWPGGFRNCLVIRSVSRMSTRQVLQACRVSMVNCDQRIFRRAMHSALQACMLETTGSQLRSARGSGQ